MILMFCVGETQVYTLTDVLCAPAEMMGRSGDFFKEVTEDKTTITVTRLKNSNKIYHIWRWSASLDMKI